MAKKIMGMNIEGIIRKITYNSIVKITIAVGMIVAAFHFSYNFGQCFSYRLFYFLDTMFGMDRNF